MQQAKTITKDLLAASLIMLLASLWIGLAANTVHAAFPGQNGKIVFYSGRDGAGGGFGEIYIMNSDGTGQTNISNNPGYDDEPTWSPDGTKIAFFSDRDGNYEIYTMNPDGTGVTRLTNNSVGDFDPSWSPDSNKISFDTDRDGNYEIYSMNADGTGQTRLTNNAAADYYAQWSPDVTKIIFRSDRDGNNEIYSMNADGTGQTRLTNIAAVDTYPTWSPDGTKIAFYSSRDGNYEIYSMNADGTGQTRLTNNAAVDTIPAWSPDGTKIAFDSDRDGNNELYSMNADGTGQTRLTNIAGYNYNPDWQPLIAPVATNDPAVITAFGTPVVIDVLANDTDLYGPLNPASVSVTVAAGNGTTSVNGANGAITYTPSAGFSGTDSFTYQVCSSESATLCDTAVVAVTVSPGIVTTAGTLPGLPGTGIEPGQDISKGLVAAVVVGLGVVLVGKYILRLSRKKING